MKKLSDLVTICHNDNNCIVLEVKPNSQMDLIKLGGFDGSETMFRVTKGWGHVFTLWSSKGVENWQWGIVDGGITCLNERRKSIKQQVLDAIEIDFGIPLGLHGHRAQPV